MSSSPQGRNKRLLSLVSPLLYILLDALLNGQITNMQQCWYFFRDDLEKFTEVYYPILTQYKPTLFN